MLAGPWLRWSGRLSAIWLLSLPVIGGIIFDIGPSSLPGWVFGVLLAWEGVGFVFLAGWFMSMTLDLNARLRRPRPLDLGPEAFEASWGPAGGLLAYRLQPLVRRLQRAGVRASQLLLILFALLAMVVVGLFLFVGILSLIVAAL